MIRYLWTYFAYHLKRLHCVYRIIEAYALRQSEDAIFSVNALYFSFVIRRNDNNSSFFCISCSIYCQMAWNISALLLSDKMANTSMLQKWALQDCRSLKHDKIGDLVKVTWKVS